MTAAGPVRSLREALSTQLWPLPALAVVLAVVAGVGLPLLDERIAGDLPAWLTDYLFGGGPDAARTVLAAIASSLITVTSLTFSLTVVTLQLASSQFSPRLLRTFTRDQFIRVTLALFLATFTYALTVLRTVRTDSSGRPAFVPQLSVTVAFVLALTSVFALVLFLAHLATQIRVETMVGKVHEEASATVRRVLDDRDDTPAVEPAVPVAPAGAVPLLTSATGFLVRVNGSALLSAAVDADAVVLIDKQPGTFLVDRTPVGVAWSRGPRPLDDDARERLGERVADALSTGPERTGVQDVGFGLRQLTDVATKALSPGINDPTTAVHALGHTSALLCELAGRDLGTQLLRDDDDRVRVALARPQLSDLLELAVEQPLRYGAGDPGVMVRLSTLLHDLAWCVERPADRRVVADQLARVRATTADQDFDAPERTRLAELAEQVERALRR